MAASCGETLQAGAPYLFPPAPGKTPSRPGGARPRGGACGGGGGAMDGELVVRKVWDLPLREVSGICERAGGGGRPRQLLAVGDDNHQLLVGDLEPEVPREFA